jgi:PIN domain nuclease of toxin-antitoxin system
MLLLDTHALVWLDEGSHRLRANALQAIIESLPAGLFNTSSIR